MNDKIAQILEKVQEKYIQDILPGKETIEMVSFLLGEEVFAFNIKNVKEIVIPGEIFSVPTAPDYIRGVINLKGKILPVIDIKLFLGISRTIISNHTRIIAVGDKNKLGLLVEFVIDIIYIPLTQIQPIHTTAGKIKVDYFEGEVLFDDKLLSILNIEKIMFSEELLNPR